MTVSKVNSVTAALAYLSPPSDGSKAYIVANLVRSRVNSPRIGVQLDARDIRGREHAVSLDTASFQLSKRGVPYTSFEKDEVIRAEYHARSIGIVKGNIGRPFH